MNSVFFVGQDRILPRAICYAGGSEAVGEHQAEVEGGGFDVVEITVAGRAEVV